MYRISPRYFFFKIMRLPRFFTLFGTLDENEAKSFQKYLKRLHANESDALAVFEYVKPFHPGFKEAKKLALEYIYRKVFDGDIDENEYNRKRLLNACSDLHLWLKAFLLSEKANSGSFESKLLWLTILKEKGMTTEFSNVASSLQEELNDLPKRNVPDYWKNLLVNQLLYGHLAQEVTSPVQNTFLPFARDLEWYYAVVRLKLACEAVNLKNTGHPEYGPDALLVVPELPEWLDAHEQPLFLLYRAIYLLLAGGEDAQYDRAEAIVTEHAGKIDPLELDVLLTYLRNYASPQVRKGDDQYWLRTHQLDKIGAEHGIFVKKGVITPTQYHNIVNAAGKVNDQPWAESFIVTYGAYLPDPVRADGMLLARCILLFEQREYRQILQKLVDTNHKDLHLFIRLKTMKMRCYYELDFDENTLLDYCVASEYGLRRFRKPRDGAVVATFAFIRLLKILVRKKSPKNVVTSEIEKAEPVFFKSWLLEKAAKYKAEFATRKQRP